jgi:sarcosine oxidase subunit alpha
VSATQPFRLSHGGRIDRSQLLKFTCNRRGFVGYAGDTLASALLANGVRVVGRSFKFHRPRGVLSAGIEETNALFRVDIGPLSVPLVRATLQPLIDGLVATTENAFPSVAFDLGRILDLTHFLWPAGFYHKTFKWPSWRWYEEFFRRAAGSGYRPAGSDPTAYYQHNLHCDVLVVGAGPAGLAAAQAAARTGARVVLIEQEPQLGCNLIGNAQMIGQVSAARWGDATIAELAAASHVKILTSTLVAGYYDHNTVLAVDRSEANNAPVPIERLWKVRAKRVVLATGSIEQPLVFAQNDRPGVMLSAAVRRYVTEFAVAAGRAAVVATNNDDAYSTAFVLQDAGIAVPAIVDCRRQAGEGVAQEAQRRGLNVLPSAMLLEARGYRSVSQVAVAEVSADGRAVTGRPRSIDCDLVAMSGGWSPTLQLYSQAGGKLRYREDLACFAPEACRAHLCVVGSANGTFDLSAAIDEGRAAAVDSARRADTWLSAVIATSGCRRSPWGPHDRQWIDFRHDVTVADIELAVRENFVSVEHLKRYTTTGMSLDQGKTSNTNAISLLADLTGRTIPEVGTPTARPMFSPVSFGVVSAGMIGDLYAPVRRLSAHRWHVANGAAFENYGAWTRPAYYRRSGETRDAAIARETLIVRNAVGLFEATPLGKIELRGPDASELLNRLYVNNIFALQPGGVRYGVMLNENGIVLDDGVIACLAPDHYLVSTTSGNSDRIASWIDEWHQCEWPRLNVILLPVTAQWAVLTIAGPRARDVLHEFESDIDFSSVAFPHMAIRTGVISRLPVRVQRVSFSGELTFEISVPARSAEPFWIELVAAGTALGIAPVGVESILLTRLEKGFLHVGTDTDGTTNALDVGLGATIAKKTGDFVGRRSLLRSYDTQPQRRQLVGIEPVDPRANLAPGAHLVRESGGRRISQGFVTSACHSPTLRKAIGLGLLECGFSRLGEIVTVFDDGRSFSTRIVKPGFYDPTGRRMHD